jgi:hypothetical protein
MEWSKWADWGVRIEIPGVLQLEYGGHSEAMTPKVGQNSVFGIAC